MIFNIEYIGDHYFIINNDMVKTHMNDINIDHVVDMCLSLIARLFSSSTFLFSPNSGTPYLLLILYFQHRIPCGDIFHTHNQQLETHHPGTIHAPCFYWVST